MKRFLYFLPDFRGGCPTVQVLRDAGIGYAFPRQGAALTDSVGPNGAQGCIVAFGDGTDMAYRPDEQLWTRLSDKAWVGLSRDRGQRPGPNELQRRERLLDGDAVELSDGNVWQIPVARFANGDTNLPRVITLDENGRPAWKPLPEFEPLMNLALEIKGQVLTGAPKYTPADLLLLGSLALQANYRIGPAEVGMLELLTTDACCEIARILLDCKNLERLLDEVKKKMGVASDNGQTLKTGASESPDTVLPGQK